MKLIDRSDWREVHKINPSMPEWKDTVIEEPYEIKGNGNFLWKNGVMLGPMALPRAEVGYILYDDDNNRVMFDFSKQSGQHLF